MMPFIDRWLRDDIKAMNAYEVPDATGMVKLDAMELPFSCSATLNQQQLAQLAQVPLNRYPDPNADKLNQALRKLMNIPDKFGVLLGNGSDELIQLLALGCAPNDTIISVEPSFVMYAMIAKFTHLNYQAVALDSDFELELSAMLSAIKTHSPKIIFIAYPNNPTGNTFKRESIEHIIQATDALVVLDEAYYAYTDDSFLADIERYPNLVVLRTVSKIGFAGLRLGLLIGNNDTIAALNKLRLPYNINALTQFSGHFLLQQTHQINQNARLIIEQRQRVMAALGAITALTVYPSQANFILFKATDVQALFAHLQAHHILIKNLAHAAKLTNCLRVTIGNAEENQLFIQAVEDFYD